jgi:enamine deaminase RidA (YjgF/YER057c/UK114 family)
MTRLVRALDFPGVTQPAPHYADAVVAGNLLFVSGLLPLDAAGRLVGGDDAGAQAAHILGILKHIVEASGSSLGNVAKLTVFMTDLSRRAAVNAARIACFGAWRPASTLVQVSGLIAPGALLEIDAVAVVTEGKNVLF